MNWQIAVKVFQLEVGGGLFWFMISYPLYSLHVIQVMCCVHRSTRSATNTNPFLQCDSKAWTSVGVSAKLLQFTQQMTEKVSTTCIELIHKGGTLNKVHTVH